MGKKKKTKKGKKNKNFKNLLGGLAKGILF
jgi:hypothetical protein